MNRINPIHIGIFLVVVLAFLAMKLGSVKSELEEAKSEYKKTEQIASKLVGLKKAYGEKNEVKTSIRKILSLSPLRSANIEQKVKKSSIVISSVKIDKNALNSLMGKLLNGAYNISSFKVKKLSQNSASFEMEIKW